MTENQPMAAKKRGKKRATICDGAEPPSKPVCPVDIPEPANDSPPNSVDEVTARDITDRKRAQNALRESEARYRTLFNSMLEGFCIIEVIFDVGNQPVDYRFLEINPAFEKQAGFQDAQGRLMRDLVPDLESNWFEIFGRIVLTGKSARFVNEARALNRWYDVSAFRFGETDSRKVAVFFTDITESKRSEETLRQSERRERERATELAAILDAVPTPVLIAHDPDCLHVTGNRAADALLRNPRGAEVSLKAPAETRPHHFRAVKDGRDLRNEELPCQLAAQGFPVQDFDFRLFFDDGTIREMLAYATPLADEGGPPRGAISVLVDITERKRAEAALRESECFARSVLDGLSAHIAIVGAEGTIEAVNSAWSDFATANGNNSRDLQVGANYLSVCDRSVGQHSEEGPPVAAGIRAVLARQMTEYAIEYPCHGPKEKRWFLARVTPFPGEGPRRVVIAHENITKRKELEYEVVEIASLEQRRIGQDLHDSVSQELTALSMLVGDLAETMTSDPSNAASLVERIALGLQRSQRELRSVMHGLCPVSVDAEGLMAALSDLATRIRQEGNVNCTFDCPKLVLVEDNLIATHLYLIALEAVHNAVKHARCQNIRISVQASDVLFLRVQDDGVGISGEPTEDHRGLGLRIMRNRAAIIRATLTIELAKPTGTLVTCTLARRKHAT